MAFDQFPIRAIGQAACRALEAAATATVRGVTSRGVFLASDDGPIVFLSNEAARGPLTLNVTGGAGLWRSLAPGMPVQVDAELLALPTARLSLTLAGAEIWEAAPPERPLSAAESYRQRLAAVAAAVVMGKPTDGLAGALLAFLGREARREDAAGWLSILKRVRDSLADGSALRAAQALTPALGLGPGLTPSGDDLALGVLLAVNRWGRQLGFNLDMVVLNEAVCQSARRKSTTLSANLLQCAAEGQADERLVGALDGILTGEPEPAQCTENLLTWGSSSGVDTLAGMACVIRAAEV